MVTHTYMCSPPPVAVPRGQMCRPQRSTVLALNGVLMSACFAGLEGCVVACIVISAAIVPPALSNSANALLYLLFSVGTFAAPGILAHTGAKRGMVLGMGAYGLYTAGFLLPTPEIMLPASAIGGFAGAVLWTAQGEYFTLNALAYAAARMFEGGGGPSDSAAIGTFAGLFAMLFPLFLLVGKLSGSILLSYRPDQPSLLFEIYTAVCSCARLGPCPRLRLHMLYMYM